MSSEQVIAEILRDIDTFDEAIPVATVREYIDRLSTPAARGGDAQGDAPGSIMETVNETIAGLRRHGIIPPDAACRWITQTTFYDPAEPDACTGNCTESAVASILGLPLESVPKWAGIKSPEFWDAVDEFLGSHGFVMHMLSHDSRPEGMYLASGQSPRGCSHMVVMEGGKLLHDPHPSRAGIDPIEHVWLLVPKDPANATIRQLQARNAEQAAELARLRAIAEAVERAPVFAARTGDGGDKDFCV